MFCQACGKELPSAVVACPACGAPVGSAPRAGSPDPVATAVADLQRAAKDLAVNAARLSRRLASEAEAAAQDPSGSARKVAKKVAQELENVSRDVEKILKDL